MHWSGHAKLAAGLLTMAMLSQSARAQPPNATDGSDVRACPAAIGNAATCYSGRDTNGAWYVAAVPKQWNHILVVHSHGGPRLDAPKADDPDEDLDRFAVMVQRGYAWIGSTYRRGGYGVRMAAADTDSSRAIFWQRFGKPRLTILHGQSYGGNVAAKLAELGATDVDGQKLYDGVMLTNGVLLGGTHAYSFRADLRAVYQYYCRNHPQANEPQYPLWQGLPRDSRMTRSALEARVNDCTGANLAPDRRSPEQKARLLAITRVTGIAEDQIVRHLEWATFLFRDLTQERLGGRNPFDNSKTVYSGSPDDAALNAGVPRFSADPGAVASLAYDSDLTGLIVVPTIAVHWEKDPIASPEGDKAYQRSIAGQGRSDLFLRLTSGEGTHSRLPSADVVAVLDAVAGWVDTSHKPESADVRAKCQNVALQLKSNCTIR